MSYDHVTVEFHATGSLVKFSLIGPCGSLEDRKVFQHPLKLYSAIRLQGKEPILSS